MAKNRKYRTAAVRFGPALKATLLCLAIGSTGVGYVWQKSQIAELGKQILKRERRLADLTEQNEKLRKTLASLRSPTKLEQRIRDLNKELNLGLGPALPSQIVVLTEPTGQPVPVSSQLSVVSSQ
ncbi:MAG: hypothetical protein C5B50_12175 [Verrucomicrobia bacterium]|nr:MAG: hypothetical protein C5B50_12175 [Verrucomicrobiota bacterium]